MRLLTGLAVAVLAASALADTPPPTPPITLHRLNGTITVDGDLSDSGWQDAAKFDQFYETSPGDNVPAKVKTIAYVSYDDRYLYIGVRCEDPHPEKIRAPYVERDNVIGTDDNIAVFLDTRNDKRTAMELRVNPRGIQADGLFNDANGNEDFSPDFFYDTAAKIDSGGWSAEYRIPFSSLRYSDAAVQTWNIMVWRNYPREFRYAFHTTPIARDSSCFICHVHPLLGLEGLPKSGHLVAAPYVTAQNVSTPANDETKTDAGLDVKWTPSQNQAVDLTLNPDFSQVEADVAQITVNQRFAVFFPEKRPFFLEGFDLFDTPIQVAYTRNITAPRWGTRSTGRIFGSAYTVLVAGDDGGGLTIIPGPQGSSFAPQDFKSTDAIARIRHDIGASFVGAVFTDREIRGSGHNRVIGPDFQWRTEANTLTGEVLYSQNLDPKVYGGGGASSHAAYLGWNHLKRKYDWFIEGKDIGDDFRADLGFVPQNGYREVDGGFNLRFFPEHSKIFRFVRPGIFVDRQTDTDGNVLFRRVSPQVFLIGAKNLTVQTGVRVKEQVLVGSQLLDETYGFWFAQFDPSRRFPRITFQGTAGESIDFANGRTGHGASLGLAATLRPIDKITLEPNVSREWLDVSGGRLYTASVERLKTTYSFSSKSIVRIIGQYVTTERNPSRYTFPVDKHGGSFLGSVLYSYKINWQTVLFLGYGDDRTLTPSNDLVKQDRSLFFKVSYAIQR
jgi:hypothetical protein